MAPRRAVNFSCRAATEQVSNQKEEGLCMKMALADMVGTVLRIHGSMNTKLVVSPQNLTDLPVKTDLRETVLYCTDREKGLESVDVCPFIRYKRSRGIAYQTDPDERHTVRYLGYYEGIAAAEGPNLELVYYPGGGAEVEKRLTKMFKEGGERLPCIGVLRLGELVNPEIAKEFANVGTSPFHHPRLPNNEDDAVKTYGEQHAVVIVGIDTRPTDPNERWCEIKNTHGEKWGDGGFSRVGFDVFEYVLIPRMRVVSTRHRHDS
ncbi:uncharacterized protein [Rutidosis leptorrhynchoides]|uniref:uncharacterized protein n=1 Tax=Rutidosis leptorrhynchoides TaxID=125765 RepID=UPI003A99803C